MNSCPWVRFLPRTIHDLPYSSANGTLGTVVSWYAPTRTVSGVQISCGIWFSIFPHQISLGMYFQQTRHRVDVRTVTNIAMQQLTRPGCYGTVFPNVRSAPCSLDLRGPQRCISPVHAGDAKSSAVTVNSGNSTYTVISSR